jgi:hypothetical protein
MSALAARWSELLIAELSQDEHLTVAAQGSLLRPPATEAEIQEAEARLGCALPPSYREFLLVNNGAYGDDYGPTVVYGPDEPEQPRPESPTVGVGFLPVQAHVNDSAGRPIRPGRPRHSRAPAVPRARPVGDLRPPRPPRPPGRPGSLARLQRIADSRSGPARHAQQFLSRLKKTD